MRSLHPMIFGLMCAIALSLPTLGCGDDGGTSDTDTTTTDDTTATTDTAAPVDTTVPTDTTPPKDTTVPNDTGVPRDTTVVRDTAPPPGPPCVDDPFFAPGWENERLDCSEQAKGASDPAAEAEACLKGKGMTDACHACQAAAAACHGGCRCVPNEPPSLECSVCTANCDDDLEDCAGRETAFDTDDTCLVADQYCSEGALVTCLTGDDNVTDYEVDDCSSDLPGAATADCTLATCVAQGPGASCYDYVGGEHLACRAGSLLAACILNPGARTSSCGGSVTGEGSGQTASAPVLVKCANVGDGKCITEGANSYYCLDVVVEGHPTQAQMGHVVDCGPGTDVCVDDVGCFPTSDACDDELAQHCEVGEVCDDNTCVTAVALANPGFESPAFTGGGAGALPTDWTVIKTPDVAANIAEVRTTASITTVSAAPPEGSQFINVVINEAGRVEVRSTTTVEVATGEVYEVRAAMIDAVSCDWTTGGPALAFVVDGAIVDTTVFPIADVGDDTFTQHVATWTVTSDHDGGDLTVSIVVDGDTPAAPSTCKPRLGVDRVTLHKQ